MEVFKLLLNLEGILVLIFTFILLVTADKGLFVPTVKN